MVNGYFLTFTKGSVAFGPGQPSQYSDSLRAGRSGDRIPVQARFSAPVQTGPGTHSALYTRRTGLFPGVKRPGRGVDHPSPSSAEVKERIELYLCSTSGPSWPVKVTLTFTFNVAFILKAERSSRTRGPVVLLDWFTLENGGTTVLRNVGKHLPIDTASHFEIFQSEVFNSDKCQQVTMQLMAEAQFSFVVYSSRYLFLDQNLNMSAIFGTFPEHRCGTAGVLLADGRTDTLCKTKRRMSMNFQLTTRERLKTFSLINTVSCFFIFL